MQRFWFDFSGVQTILPRYSSWIRWPSRNSPCFRRCVLVNTCVPYRSTHLQVLVYIYNNCFFSSSGIAFLVSNAGGNYDAIIVDAFDPISLSLSPSLSVTQISASQVCFDKVIFLIQFRAWSRAFRDVILRTGGKRSPPWRSIVHPSWEHMVRFPWHREASHEMPPGI